MTTDTAVDLSTPRRSIAAFLASAHEDRWQDAARALDMREIPANRQSEVGIQTARELASVLDARRVHAESLTDTPGEGDTAFEVAEVTGIPTVVALRRVRRDGVTTWLFAPATVRAASQMAERVDRGPLGNLAPRALIETQMAGLEAWQWIAAFVSLVLASLLAWAAGKLVESIAVRIAGKDDHGHRARSLLHAVEGPLRGGLFLGASGLLAELVHFPPAAMGALGRVYGVTWVVLAAWLFLRLVDFGASEVADRAAQRDGWRARGTRTRVMVLRRVLRVVGIVVLSAVLLMQFDPVRQLGLSLLASAGVAGVVVGLAAQRTIGNLLAGIQLSFTQPLRVGDEVVIEGQSGTVEEINLSYVVVTLWDQRSLIVPMTKLLESAFENGTRASNEIYGDVKIMVDFGTPFERVREEITAFVKSHPLFDGRKLVVQVTDARERTAELRVVVSAADSSKLFDLRCATREFLLGVLQRLDSGRYLPRVRVNPSGATSQTMSAVADVSS